MLEFFMCFFGSLDCTETNRLIGLRSFGRCGCDWSSLQGVTLDARLKVKQEEVSRKRTEDDEKQKRQQLQADSVSHPIGSRHFTPNPAPKLPIAQEDQRRLREYYTQ
eukprot:12636-Amphidinium_carterae.1